MGDTYNDFNMPVEDESIIVRISSSENLFIARAVLERAQQLGDLPRTEERDQELRVAFGLVRRMLDLTREAAARDAARIRGLLN